MANYFYAHMTIYLENVTTYNLVISADSDSCVACSLIDTILSWNGRSFFMIHKTFHGLMRITTDAIAICWKQQSLKTYFIMTTHWYFFRKTGATRPTPYFHYEKQGKQPIDITSRSWSCMSNSNQRNTMWSFKWMQMVILFM